MTETRAVSARLTAAQVKRLDWLCEISQRTRSAVIGLAIDALRVDDLALPGLTDNGRERCEVCGCVIEEDA